MSKINLNRRQLFGAATAAMATQVGTSLLSTPEFAGHPLAKAIRSGIGNSEAFAAAGAVGMPVKNPIAVVFLSAKCDAATLLFSANDQAAGVVGNANFVESTVFPSLHLANWFGTPLASIEATHSLALCPVGKALGNNAGGGNHDYNGTIAEQSKTGTLSYYLGKAQSDLMSLNFGVNATADTATAVISEGGTQLVSYNSVKTAADAIMGAINPLKKLPADADKVKNDLNTLVSKDTAFKAKLAELGEVLGSTTGSLTAVKAAADVQPMAQFSDTNGDYMDATILAANNPLLLQLDAATTLHNAGLARICTYCVGSNDVNGGGNHLQPGGRNTDRPGVSAVTAKAMLAQFIAEFVKRFPEGAICFAGEGGRSSNGGDRNVMLGGIVAAKSVLKTVMLGYTGAYDNPANYGNTVPQLLSDGTTNSPSIASLMATTAKAVGYDFGPHAYIKGLLVKG